MNEATKPAAAPEVVFTMGLPGAGKSTVLRTLGLLDTHTVLDSDQYLEAHPDYDPKHPENLYHWAVGQLEAAWQAAVATGRGQWIVDGTGTNAERMIRKIREAKARGFATRLVYVRVTLETALERNAKRARTVPTDIIHSKARDIVVAHDIVRREVDTVTIIDND